MKSETSVHHLIIYLILTAITAHYIRHIVQLHDSSRAVN